MSQADKPRTLEGQTYHLHTHSGDLAPLCLLVGSPERAELIAQNLLNNAKEVGSNRGLKSFTGTYKNVPVSVVTTGMGAASIGIVLPEAYESGARLFIRVGSCSALQSNIELGSSIIVTNALRFEGASLNWAPQEFEAVANKKIVAALENSAQQLAPQKFHLGVEATTDCFYEGQARPNVDGVIPEHLAKRHEELMRSNVACYSMEASALFVWCSTHKGGIPA